MGKVKVFGLWASSYSVRVEIALSMKGVEYEFVEIDLLNKSDELLRYNPIHKKIPVLVHDGKPITESLLIMEYIDETWKGDPILPSNPYERARARFWAKYIDDKIIPPFIITAFLSKGEESQKATEELDDIFKNLENEIKGKKFFGGNNIGYLDIVASKLAYWIPSLQEVVCKEVLTKEKYPCFCNWADEILRSSVIKQKLPDKQKLQAFYRTDLAQIYDKIGKAKN